jgi:hypothetical protein
LQLIVGDVGAEAAVGADAVAILANPFRQVEDDSDGEAVILTRQLNERFSVFGLYVGGVGNGEAAGRFAATK